MSQPESEPPSRGAVAAAEHDLSDAEFAELDELLAEIPGAARAARRRHARRLPLRRHRPADAARRRRLAAVRVRRRRPPLGRGRAVARAAARARPHPASPCRPEPLDRRIRQPSIRSSSRSTTTRRRRRRREGTPATRSRDRAAARRRADPPPPVDPIGAALLPWVAGFEQAVHLLPGLAELDDPAVATTLARLFRFLPDDERGHRGAGRARAAARFARRRDRRRRRLRRRAVRADPAAALQGRGGAPLAPKVGRNDPCPCGSGRKFKQCHGAAAPA